MIPAVSIFDVIVMEVNDAWGLAGKSDPVAPAERGRGRNNNAANSASRIAGCVIRKRAFIASLWQGGTQPKSCARHVYYRIKARMLNVKIEGSFICLTNLAAKTAVVLSRAKTHSFA